MGLSNEFTMKLITDFPLMSFFTSWYNARDPSDLVINCQLDLDRVTIAKYIRILNI